MQSHASSLAGKGLMLGSSSVGKGELQDTALCPALFQLWHTKQIIPRT